MDIKYYKTCSTLPIFNFYKIIDGDLRFLVIDSSELNVDEVIVTSEFTDIFNVIFEEYSELTRNKEVTVSLNLQLLVSEQEFERDILQRTLTLFNETSDLKILSILSDFGFNIDESKDFDAFLNNVISRVKGLNNKIRINKVKYAKRFKQETKNVKRNLDKESLMLEMSLELGREIDTHKTSVSKWVNMIEVSKEKSARVEKIRNK